MEKDKTPEWEIFKRLERVEKVKPTAQDAFILAQFTLLRSFYLSELSSSNPRKNRDNILNTLKEAGLSKRTLQALHTMMTQICESVEKH